MDKTSRLQSRLQSASNNWYEDRGTRVDFGESFLICWTHSLEQPKKITDILCIEQFKAKLKTYLCAQAYNNNYDKVRDGSSMQQGYELTERTATGAALGLSDKHVANSANKLMQFVMTLIAAITHDAFIGSSMIGPSTKWLNRSTTLSTWLLFRRKFTPVFSGR